MRYGILWLGLVVLGLSGCGDSDTRPEETEPSQPLEPLTLDVMSFNIRYGTASDGDNSWTYRKEYAAEVGLGSKPDILGLQEAWLFQLEEFESYDDSYGILVRSREESEDFGESVPLLYSAEWILDPVEHGTFWLSDTPEVPGSTSWGNGLPRIVTWARLVHIQRNQGVYVFNLHLDHQSVESRNQSMALVLEFVAERLTEDPVIIMGDFNASESSDALNVLRDAGFVDSFRALYPDESNAGTFHGFAGGSSGGKIDYLMVDGGFEVLEATIDRSNRDGVYPSDHYPVTARLRVVGE